MIIAKVAARISVAIASYNGEAFIGEQLASLSTQTLLPSELVVCDDGSTDKTLDLVKTFAGGAPFPVHVHWNERRLGFADNFLKAAALCTSDIVAFCDQDDVWLPGKLEAVADALSAPDVLCLLHRGYEVEADLGPPRRTLPPIRRDHIEPALTGDPFFFAPGWAMAFRRNLLTVINGDRRPASRYFEGKMSHDEWIYFLAFVCGKRAFRRAPLALHRQHGGNTAGKSEYPLSRRVAVARCVSADAYRGFASLALMYADFLRQIANEPSPYSPEFAAGASFFASIGDLWEHRAQLYESASSWARLQRFLTLAATGAYRSRESHGFGLDRLAKDIVFALIGHI